jgi:hypothetical protein
MSEETGEGLRDEGVQAVIAADEAPHRGYRAVIEKVLSDLIDAGEPFTADHVNRALDDETRTHASPYLVPALFRTAAQSGRIKVVGYAISERPRRHSGVLRVWMAADAEEAA